MSDFGHIFESILDDITAEENRLDSAGLLSNNNTSGKHIAYLYETFRDYERAAWDAGYPLIVCIELMLFLESNQKFVEYFDLIEEMLQNQRFPHMELVAALSDGREMQLVRPDTEKRVASACYYIAIKPTLRLFLDFMTIVSSLTLRANSKSGLTPSVEVYQKWNGKDAKLNPYKSETTHGSWQDLLGFLYTRRIRMLPIKNKKNFQTRIDDISTLLMKHEWFYYDLHYDFDRMEKELKNYFEKFNQLASQKDKS